MISVSWYQTGLSWQDIYGNSTNYSFHLWWAEKQHRKHNTFALETDRFHSCHIMQGQESEAKMAQTHQNWTAVVQKNIIWSEYWFLMRHADGEVRIWHWQDESRDLTCLVSKVQTGVGGVMMWGKFSVSFNSSCASVERIVTDHVSLFMATI